MERKIPEIVQHDTPKGEKALRAISTPIKDKEIGTKEIQNLILDLKAALKTQSDGVAISAPQIAVNKRVFVINPELHSLLDIKDQGNETVMINPEIIKMSKDKKSMDEGCLSVRPWYGKVKRATRATIKALNEKGEEYTLDGTGLMAQIFQHEIDHLDGILFIDKAKDLKKMPLEFFDN